MNRRHYCSLLSSLSGVCLGLAADFFRAGQIPVADVVGAVLLSPIAVTIGGLAVSPPVLSVAFFLGGLAFWPAYILLLRSWHRQGSPWVCVAIFLWCAQGYYQAVHRFWVMMSA